MLLTKNRHFIDDNLHFIDDFFYVFVLLAQFFFILLQPEMKIRHKNHIHITGITFN